MYVYVCVYIYIYLKTHRYILRRWDRLDHGLDLGGSGRANCSSRLIHQAVYLSLSLYIYIYIYTYIPTFEFNCSCLQQ